MQERLIMISDTLPPGETGILIRCLGLIAAGALLLVATVTPVTQAAESVERNRVPDVVLRAFDGASITLSDFAGKTVLLNFWGIWCTRCRDEIPRLVELDRKWRRSGLVVLGADYGDDPKDLPAFIEEIGMSYPALIDDGLADDYEVLIYPTSVVIDRSGRVRYRVEGFTDKSFAALASVVERLLAES